MNGSNGKVIFCGRRYRIPLARNGERNPEIISRGATSGGLSPLFTGQATRVFLKPLIS
jgi:hypothetical protein